jgi:phage gp45-like
VSLIDALTSKLRNLFLSGTLKRRYEDGNIQVEISPGDVREKKEAHPYGFKANAKKGTVFVFCQGGSADRFEFLPAVDYDGGPLLNENDAALYTASGGWIICRESGEVELFGKDLGGLIKVDELKNQLAKLTARVDGIMNAMRNSPTAPNDGGSAYKGGIAAALNAIADKEDFSSIASDKVFHGSGS